MHEVHVNRLGGLSLSRKSMVRLTDRPDMILYVYHGRKTTMQQQQQQRSYHATAIHSLNRSLLDARLNSLHSNVCRIEINQYNQAFSLFYEFRNSEFRIRNTEFRIRKCEVVWKLNVSHLGHRTYMRKCSPTPFCAR